MPRIAFPPFAPDVASVDAAVCGVARNVVPRADGYGPVRAFAPISSALPDACRGAITVESPAFGFPVYFAGTGSRLYRFDNATAGWTDVSKTGATYGVPPGDYWSFTVYGTRLIACHAGDVPQVIDIDAGRTFADLGGAPPRARFAALVGEFLVLAGLPAQPNAIRWSDLGDIAFWDPGRSGHQADVQVLPDGGNVTGFAGGEFGLVFQESAIRRLVYNPGSVETFDVSIAEENRGAVAPWSLAKVGAKVFFLDRDGFYVFTGGASTPVGAERVNRYLASRVDPNTVGQVCAIRDATGPRVIWAFRSPAADPADPSLLDSALLYDWLLDRWTTLDVAVRFGTAAATPATSLDALPGTLEGQALTFDAPQYAGGVPALGIVTADNRLALATGAPLEATLETAEAMLARPNRAFVRGVRLDGDADDWRVAVGSRESLAASELVRWRPESAPNHARFAPARASGRYHRARVRIPAGTAWTYAAGIEPDATGEGGR